MYKAQNIKCLLGFHDWAWKLTEVIRNRVNITGKCFHCGVCNPTTWQNMSFHQASKLQRRLENGSKEWQEKLNGKKATK